MLPGFPACLTCLLVAEAPSNKYQKAAMLADALQKGEKEEPGVHYKVDEKQKSVLMTDEGYEEAEEALGVRPAPCAAPLLHSYTPSDNVSTWPLHCSPEDCII